MMSVEGQKIDIDLMYWTFRMAHLETGEKLPTSAIPPSASSAKELYEAVAKFSRVCIPRSA